MNESVRFKLQAAPDSVCALSAVGENVLQITPEKMFEKIGEFKNPFYGPNTILYRNETDYCVEKIKIEEGIRVKEDQAMKYRTPYVDSLEAFRVRFNVMGIGRGA
ncbi:hypothetical protein PoB_006280400 [Plakobranchus ocellatus]|uniref:Uncharacterized protein n=1 Tax=Plakobranchus ocellatus TaxID=259542 RepID=A0AAV4CWN4_9GAST|nr:hypothetical protein PoB_006280400 [Plakobranchus ocellatus]